MTFKTLMSWSAACALVLAAAAAPLGAATPASGTLSEANPVVSWTGGPFVVSNPNACAGPADPSCDNFVLEIEVPSFAPYVVVIEIDSTSATPDQDDYDMYIYGPGGQQVDSSTSSGSAERVGLFDAAAGTYRVEIQPWLVTPGTTYAGQARLINNTPPPLVGVAPPSPGSIFATPTLVDSQLHTGEPSIDVSPVLPSDGSRPLIVGDAPYGTSNATSLWWRSQDGGESYHLVQDPLAAPRPRPCEEIDGGGDSDTIIGHDGAIYVNDLAALINITVGVSTDDFQTMSCSKAGGSNPLQPIQDRQWVLAAPDADGSGPNVDSYITFRRGLIGGNPVTETAIQIHASTDGGNTYQFVGEIADFFGFANDKVSQTGNPVIDETSGPRRGTIYHAYYLSNTAKVGRYTPSTNTFEALTVAERFSDVGNVFPTVAIDTDGNLYYAWVEGGSFDVLLATSTDGGDSWSVPVRLNLPGDSELAVNPYAIAGSAGRVAVLYNATAGTTSPDGAVGGEWNLYVAQSTNALSANPTYTQYQVTDTPLHFGPICTGGLGCTISGGDRSLLEFNEVDVDLLDGSLVFIFADNGRLPQPPLAPTEIPQPYIMATRQIGGQSMIAGKTIQNTLPRINHAIDAMGDSHYPKAGTALGPLHPSLDLLASHLEATPTGVKAVVAVATLSDLSQALAVEYGFGDPRVTQKASWVTRFEVEHTVLEGGSPVTREEVFALGMEYDLVAGGPTFWYGTVGVARNALQNIKRSNYSLGDGVVTTGTVSGSTFEVEIPYAFMGLDLATDPKPVFHSVVTFALAQPEAELEGMPVASYFNYQRTVDASAAYDWTLGDPLDDDDDDGDPANQGRVHGSGYWHGFPGIDGKAEKVNFSFDAKLDKKKGLQGKLKVKDKEADVDIDAREITSLTTGDGTCNGAPTGAGAFEFTAVGEFNGVPGAELRVCGEDHGKKGKGSGTQPPDRLYVECIAGCTYDTAGRTPDDGIDGGNIHLHDPIVRSGQSAALSQPADGPSLSLRTASAEADVVSLDPILLSEAPAGSVLVLTVVSETLGGLELGSRQLVLHWSRSDGSSGQEVALSDALGVAVFPVVVPAGETEYVVTDGDLESNAVAISGQ